MSHIVRPFWLSPASSSELVLFPTSKPAVSRLTIWPTWLLEHGQYHFVALSCTGPGIIVQRFLGLGCQKREHTDTVGQSFGGHACLLRKGENRDWVMDL